MPRRRHISRTTSRVVGARVGTSGCVASVGLNEAGDGRRGTTMDCCWILISSVGEVTVLWRYGEQIHELVEINQDVRSEKATSYAGKGHLSERW